MAATGVDSWTNTMTTSGEALKAHPLHRQPHNHNQRASSAHHQQKEAGDSTILSSSSSSSSLRSRIRRGDAISAETVTNINQRERRTLLNLCLGMLGRHLEDVLDELSLIAEIMPASLKMALLAIARRRGLLGNEVLVTLLDEDWETLDVSGSNVTDLGMEITSKKCHLLKAVDISRCDGITALSVRALVENCSMLQTLRCGGTSRSNEATRKSLHFILPRLDFSAEAEDSWEDLELKQVGRGAQVLRWLVWPAIDQGSRERLLAECPKVMVNPPSGGRRGMQNVPLEALPDVTLDDCAIHGIDPDTWASKYHAPIPPPSEADVSGLSIAERFKLAFMQRDERLAPKRAKNLRQNQRRAEKAWLQLDTDAKAVFWAGAAQRSLRK